MNKTRKSPCADASKAANTYNQFEKEYEKSDAYKKKKKHITNKNNYLPLMFKSSPATIIVHAFGEGSFPYLSLHFM